MQPSSEPSQSELPPLIALDPDTAGESVPRGEESRLAPSVETLVPYLALYADSGPGRRDNALLCAPVRMNAVQTVRFENIESLRPVKGSRLCITPLYSPAFLRISHIVITRVSDGLVLYRAKAAGEFDQINASESAVKQVSDGLWTVDLSDGQSISLPAVDIPTAESCRLEIAVEPYGGSPIAQRSSETVRAQAGEVVSQAGETSVSEPPSTRLEGFRANTIEFQTPEAALGYALRYPREKAAGSDHGKLLAGITIPLPREIETI